MRRLNVRQAQIDECIQKSMFALPVRPKDELLPGELLLLQLSKADAKRSGKLSGRIDFALVFERLEKDHDGTLSRHHWPAAGQEWKWIVYGSETVPTIPFSLEDLPLSQSYSGQDNARRIKPQDEELVRPFIQWSLAQRPEPNRQIVPAVNVALEFGKQKALQGIFNHDRIAPLKDQQPALVTEQRYARNPWLADTLKGYYDHRCQICGRDFAPEYGVPMADTHHIQYLRDGGADISANMVVLCPNHHRLIHATDALFVREQLAYLYPNGLIESLRTYDHLSEAPIFSRAAGAGSGR